jgi:hypothetical protein
MDSNTETIHISFYEKETNDVNHRGRKVGDDLIIYVILFVIIVFIIGGLLSIKKNESLTQSKECKLSGQFQKGANSVLLETSLGIYLYKVELKTGKLCLSHTRFNPDGGTWTMMPGSQPAFYDMDSPGSYTFRIEVGEYDNMMDCLQVVNKSVRKKAIFSYTIEHLI